MAAAETGRHILSGRMESMFLECGQWEQLHSKNKRCGSRIRCEQRPAMSPRLCRIIGSGRANSAQPPRQVVQERPAAAESAAEEQCGGE